MATLQSSVPTVKLLINYGFVISFLLSSSLVKAQVISDPSLKTKVRQEAGKQIITGGQQRGSNLFHSFQQFSPTANFATYFDNALEVQNIFSRVTGNIPSVIDGMLTTNGSASLFLLNPAGIILGENAQLNIAGSFVGTTADSIIFADGTEFSSQLSNSPPLLTVSIPVGLQYGNNPGTIVSNPQANFPLNINVVPNQNFVLIGGDVTLNYTNINALSGKVTLGSVASFDIVELKVDSQGWNFNYGGVQKLGNINLTNDTFINTSGSNGVIQLTGNNLTISNSGILNFIETEQSNSLIDLSTRNAITLNQAVLITQVGGQGNPEDNLDTNPLDSLIQGNAGNIFLSASNIKIDQGSVISAGTFGQGKGGNIIINTEELSILGYSEFVSSLITTATASSASGGNITINANQIQIADGARIDSSSFGTGKAGTIKINAQDSLIISNSRPFGNAIIPSGVFAAAGIEDLPFEFQLPGQSGNLNINAAKLLLQNNGQISVSNFGTENAGNIFINVEEFRLETGGKIIAETASGKGGSIFITSDLLVLSDDSSISAKADRNGNGGNLEIKTTNLVLLEDSLINADAKLGDGGNVTIYTEGLFTVVDPETVITASSERGVDGIVEIINPNTEAKKEVITPIKSSWSAENLMVELCGNNADFKENKFVYVGRGAVPNNMMDSMSQEKFLIDFGDSDYVSDFIVNYPETEKAVQEATNLIVNNNGNIELVAAIPVEKFTSGCLLNNNSL